MLASDVSTLAVQDSCCHSTDHIAHRVKAILWTCKGWVSVHDGCVHDGGVYMMGVYMMGVYMMGVYMMGVYMMGVYMMGVCT